MFDARQHPQSNNQVSPRENLVNEACVINQSSERSWVP